jgi:hypothetical protein
MRKIILAASLLLAFSLTTTAQIPRFEDYPAQVYTGSSAPVVISRRDRTFKSRLKWASRNQKVNFAGRYILASWGCGASCLMFSLIDARTGRVYSPGFSVCCWPASEEKPIEFRPDSRLLIIRGMRNEEGQGGHTIMYGIRVGSDSSDSVSRYFKRQKQ